MTEPTPASEGPYKSSVAKKKAASGYHKVMHRLGGFLHHIGAFLQDKHGPHVEQPIVEPTETEYPAAGGPPPPVASPE